MFRLLLLHRLRLLNATSLIYRRVLICRGAGVALNCGSLDLGSRNLLIVTAERTSEDKPAEKRRALSNYDQVSMKNQEFKI